MSDSANNYQEGCLKRMMKFIKKNFFKIVIIIGIIILLWIILRKFFMNEKKVATRLDLSKNRISALQSYNLGKLPQPLEGVQATYSLWFYVNNWDYKYGKDKVLFKHGDFINAIFDKTKRELAININTSKGPETPLILTNMKLQKWINLTIVYNTRLLSVYRNGMLIASKRLKGVPEPKENNIIITPDDGFSGELMNVQYYSKALSQRRIIKKLYNNGKPGSPRGLFGTGLLWWAYLNLNVNDPDV